MTKSRHNSAKKIRTGFESRARDMEIALVIKIAIRTAACVLFTIREGKSKRLMLTELKEENGKQVLALRLYG